jgi:hypothetical protein
LSLMSVTAGRGEKRLIVVYASSNEEGIGEMVREVWDRSFPFCWIFGRRGAVRAIWFPWSFEGRDIKHGMRATRGATEHNKEGERRRAWKDYLRNLPLGLPG